MFKRQCPAIFSLFMFLACAIAFAQEQAPVKRPAASVPITVAARGTLVRFTAVGAIERMRLEVFDSSGEPVLDTGFKPGNMRDWRLRGTHGQMLPDASYLCVVTVRELSGRMTFKQGTVVVQGGQAALALEGSAEPERVEAEQSLATRPAEEPPSMTVVAHDGEVGQVVSTAGDLTFRTGDIFSGKEKERMRLTEDGKLGIGTKEPQATLDVAGTVRAGKGIVFPDGTALTSATGRAQKMNVAGGDPEPLISGSGTTGRLTKWTNGPAEVLGDSVVTESASNIGIGTGAPTSKLHVVGAIQIGATSGTGVNPTLINPNAIANFAQVRFYPASGTNVNTSFAVVPKGTGQPNNRAQFSILGTDTVANPSNTEFATFRARGADFVLSTGKTGTGVIRPLLLAAGLLTDNTTNNNQLVLATDGNVGVGTNAPTAKLHVEGNVRFFGLRTQGLDQNPNFIGGSASNQVGPDIIYATIGGGGNSVHPNKVTDSGGTVGGGTGNKAGKTSDIAPSGEDATVGGGHFNTASGEGLTIGGGSDNTASGSRSTVGGGTSNIASGFSSTVPGGFANTAQGSYSFAAGALARAANTGSFVWSDSTAVGVGFFSSTADNQFLINAVGGVGIGTNAPSHQLTVGAPEAPVVPPARVGVYHAGDAFSLVRNTTNDVEGLFGAGSGEVIYGSMTGHPVLLRTGNTDRIAITATGNVGIGTNSPGGARLKVEGGNLFIGSVGNGLVLKSPNNACWLLTVANDGSLVTLTFPCP